VRNALFVDTVFGREDSGFPLESLKVTMETHRLDIAFLDHSEPLSTPFYKDKGRDEFIGL